MKAIVKSKAEPGLWLEDIPEPKIGINDVLISNEIVGAPKLKLLAELNKHARVAVCADDAGQRVRA